MGEPVVEDAAAGEGRAYLAAAGMASAGAVLLCGYEFLRSPANTLFKAAYGKAALPYVTALVPVGVIAAVYVYGKLLSWVGPRRTLLATTAGSAGLIGLLYAAIQRWHFMPATWALYVLKEAYIVLIIEQYWSYLNSTLGTETAKKVNGPVCGIAGLGSVVGAWLVGRSAERLGAVAFVGFAAGATVVAGVVSDFVYWRCGAPRGEERATKARRHEAVAGDVMGLRLFRGFPVLGVLLAVVVVTQVVSTVLDFDFQGILQDRIPAVDRQTAWSGNFFALLNAVALGMQFVAAPLLLRAVPLPAVQVGIPCVHLGTCLYLLARPSLWSAGVAFLVFKAIDYSIFRAAKEILYIPLPFDARYRAKEVIDVFGYRFGKGGTSVVVSAVQQAVIVGERALTVAALAGVFVWGAFAIPLGKYYRRSE
jgi:AAA family ATP:ADP antiporter